MMELILELISNDYILACRILGQVPAKVGDRIKVPNTQARLSLNKTPPEWDRQSPYRGIFTFSLKPVDPDEVEEIAAWLKNRFFSLSAGLSIEGVPIGEDRLGPSRYVEVLHDALVRATAKASILEVVRSQG